MGILRRNMAMTVLAGLVLGGGAVAWAGGGPARPTVLAAAQTGDTTTPSTTPETPATAPKKLTEAEREALRSCVEKAGTDAAARQACFDAAGVKPPRGGGVGPGPGGPGRPGPGRPGPFGGMGLVGRAVHGTVVVPAEGDTWQTVTFDRGVVDEATDGSKIVLMRPDGEKVTIALNADTKYHGIPDAAGIKEGRQAMVISKEGTATQVMQGEPPKMHPGPCRPGSGQPEPAPAGEAEAAPAPGATGDAAPAHRVRCRPGPRQPTPVPGNNGEAPVVPND